MNGLKQYMTRKEIESDPEQVMTYNEFMERPRRLHKRIMHKADDVAFKLEVCQKATTTIKERVQTSPGNVTEIRYAEYIDAANNLKALIGEYDAVKDEVCAFLYESLKPDEADLLEWRYIHDKDLQEIAAVTGMAYKTVRNKMSIAEKSARAMFAKSGQ